MDKVVSDWERAGLLTPHPKLAHAMPMFLVPKPDGSVRPIIDFYPWTQYIDTPRFSHLTAGKALRDIPLGSYLMKLDLKSGFHQLTINVPHRRFNGIFYRGRKLALTRLPMGHAIAPGVFQRAVTILLRHVQAKTGCGFVAYLDDWLLFHREYPVLCRSVLYIRSLGVTINDAKCSFAPVLSLSYLGFRINSADCTLTLEKDTITRLIRLLDYAAPGTTKDRQRIHGFATWILYNSRWPLFLALDILRGDPSWLRAALHYMDISHPHWFDDAPIILDVYTDSTPHSVAAFCPALHDGFAQAFSTPAEINHAEMVAAILGLHWATLRFTDVHIKIHSDNSSVVGALRTGKGRVFRRFDVSHLFLSVLPLLRVNTWEVCFTSNSTNLADRPSRDILQTLHGAAVSQQDLRPSRHYDAWTEFWSPTAYAPAPPRLQLVTKALSVFTLDGP